MLRLAPAYVFAMALPISWMSCSDTSNGDATTARDTTASATTVRDTGPSLSRAKNGDTVWVLVNHVKADKRQQFEQFVHEIFWDSSSKLSSAEQQVFRQTRILHPTAAEKDGTYSYIFLMDPVVPGGNYNIHALLNRIYDKPKATEYNKMFDETTVGDQTPYIEVQSQH
jgi:hypothetical protein